MSKLMEVPSYDFDDVLIHPDYSELTSRKGAIISRKFKFKNGIEWSGVPIIAANMDHTGTTSMAYALHKYFCFTVLHKHHDFHALNDIFNNVETDIKNSIFYSLGTHKDDIKKLDEFILETGIIPKFICLDVANGYMERFIELVNQISTDYGESSVIMAGNIACNPGAERLFNAGADIVKVGIGPGSVCTTRLKTGVGTPQLSAIEWSAEAAERCGGYICADGGCRTPGDICKSFVAGADFVMLGGMLAGHDECEGKIKRVNSEWATGEFGPFLLKTGDPVMEFYGMASNDAMNKHNGRADYRSEEGKRVEVPYKGKAEDTLQDIFGSIRSCMAYTGCKNIEELKMARFIRSSGQENRVFSV